MSLSSPPEEAEHIRRENLTPESPKPVHYPSPANIPILEKQMDPMFNDPPLSIGTPASFQQSHSQAQAHAQAQAPTPSAHSTSSFATEQQQQQDQQQHHPYQQHQQQQPASSFQNGTPQQGTGDGATPGEYQPAVDLTGGLGVQTQDTTAMQTFSTPHQVHAASSYSDAISAPSQENHPAYPYAHDHNAHAAQQAQAQSVQPNSYQTPASAGGSVDYQALLDSLTPAANSGASDRYGAAQMFTQPAQSQGNTPSSLPAAPHLPPRPPAQETLATHPNYNPKDDIRSFHPHSQKSSTAQQRGSNQLQSLNARGQDHSGSRTNLSPGAPAYGQRPPTSRSESPGGEDEDIRWPPEINRRYEAFLDQERRFVTEGQWDQFPVGSRLFIGNLPTEKVTKRDIFHRFFRHGDLAQISIKQAYGFVQFLDSKSCTKALLAEQNQAVRGRKMHLEVSKPQRNTKKKEPEMGDRNNAARRRSRSPDYTRGASGPPRYSGNSNPISPRERDNRRFRDRDDYRPMRSPSPRGRGLRSRDRTPPRYERRRSRSRSPRRGYRSPSPRYDDGLDLPRRAPHQVPDVLILVNDGLPRDYIHWVENSLKSQGLRVDVLIMSLRFREEDVIRRQIVEGVTAIVKLNSAGLSHGNVNLQVFDRRGGTNNVQFNEYENLDPLIAAQLVSQAKQTASQPVQPLNNYWQPPTSMPSFNPGHPSGTYPPTPSIPQNLSGLISSLDSNSLSQLLGAISGNNSAAQTPQPLPTGLNPDLARLLSSVSNPAQPGYNTPGQQQSLQGLNNLLQNPALASILGGQPQQAAPPVQAPAAAAPAHASAPAGQPDMNEIMAQLAKYQR